jgi:hypothetical protein
MLDFLSTLVILISFAKILCGQFDSSSLCCRTFMTLMRTPVARNESGFFHAGKVDGAWSWPLTSIYCPESVELHLHSPIWPGACLNTIIDPCLPEATWLTAVWLTVHIRFNDSPISIPLDLLAVCGILNTKGGDVSVTQIMARIWGLSKAKLPAIYSADRTSYVYVFFVYVYL